MAFNLEEQFTKEKLSKIKSLPEENTPRYSFQNERISKALDTVENYLTKQSQEDQVLSSYEVYKQAKKASEKFPQDQGMKLTVKLSKEIWRKGTGTRVTGKDYAPVKETLTALYKNSYGHTFLETDIYKEKMDLDTDFLDRLANTISNQEDYDKLIETNGFDIDEIYCNAARDYLQARANEKISYSVKAYGQKLTSHKFSTPGERKQREKKSMEERVALTHGLKNKTLTQGKLKQAKDLFDLIEHFEEEQLNKESKKVQAEDVPAEQVKRQVDEYELKEQKISPKKLEKKDTIQQATGQAKEYLNKIYNSTEDMRRLKKEQQEAQELLKDAKKELKSEEALKADELKGYLKATERAFKEMDLAMNTAHALETKEGTILVAIKESISEVPVEGQPIAQTAETILAVLQDLGKVSEEMVNEASEHIDKLNESVKYVLKVKKTLTTWKPSEKDVPKIERGSSVKALDRVSKKVEALDIIDTLKNWFNTLYSSGRNLVEKLTKGAEDMQEGYSEIMGLIGEPATASLTKDSEVNINCEDLAEDSMSFVTMESLQDLREALKSEGKLRAGVSIDMSDLQDENGGYDLFGEHTEDIEKTSQEMQEIITGDDLIILKDVANKLAEAGYEGVTLELVSNSALLLEIPGYGSFTSYERLIDELGGESYRFQSLERPDSVEYINLDNQGHLSIEDFVSYLDGLSTLEDYNKSLASTVAEAQEERNTLQEEEFYGITDIDEAVEKLEEIHITWDAYDEDSEGNYSFLIGDEIVAVLWTGSEELHIYTTDYYLGDDEDDTNLEVVDMDSFDYYDPQASLEKDSRYFTKEELITPEDGMEREAKRETCYRCQGEGEIICPECKGEGEVSSELTNETQSCLRCQGEGDIICPECDGEGFVEGGVTSSLKASQTFKIATIEEAIEEMRELNADWTAIEENSNSDYFFMNPKGDVVAEYYKNEEELHLWEGTPGGTRQEVDASVKKSNASKKEARTYDFQDLGWTILTPAGEDAEIESPDKSGTMYVVSENGYFEAWASEELKGSEQELNDIQESFIEYVVDNSDLEYHTMELIRHLEKNSKKAKGYYYDKEPIEDWDRYKLRHISEVSSVLEEKGVSVDHSQTSVTGYTTSYYNTEGEVVAQYFRGILYVDPIHYQEEIEAQYDFGMKDSDDRGTGYDEESFVGDDYHEMNADIRETDPVIEELKKIEEDKEIASMDETWREPLMNSGSVSEAATDYYLYNTRGSVSHLLEFQSQHMNDSQLKYALYIWIEEEGENDIDYLEALVHVDALPKLEEYWENYEEVKREIVEGNKEAEFDMSLTDESDSHDLRQLETGEPNSYGENIYETEGMPGAEANIKDIK